MRSQLVLLEGVCGAGKTTVSGALRNLKSSPEIVILDQNFTYAPLVPLEDAGTLDDEQNLAFLQGRIRSVRELLYASCEETRIVVLDTFHITQHLRPGVLSIDSFRRVDQLLRGLQCCLTFLWIDEVTLMRRTLVERRNTGFARYAEKFGDTEADVHAHFCREQESMWALAGKESELETQRLDATQSPARLAEAVVAHALALRDATSTASR